jgi:hypothetical protein
MTSTITYPSFQFQLKELILHRPFTRRLFNDTCLLQRYCIVNYELAPGVQFSISVWDSQLRSLRRLPTTQLGPEVSSIIHAMSAHIKDEY